MERARQRKRDADPAYRLKKKTLYSSAYKKKAKQLRDLGGICYLCGGIVPPGVGEADHVIPSQPDSPLAITHRKCNLSKSNKPLNSPDN
jgi:hypothetical protein